MQDTKITREKIKNHFTYSWWKYLLLACVAIFGWNLIYTSTAYRAPADKRLDVYFVTYSVPEEALNYFKDEIIARYDDVEDASVLSVVYTAEDNYYGSIQLTTYIGAGEGDIFVMTRERFETLTSSGAFYPLDDAIASGALDLHGIDVTSTTRTTEDGERGVYGVPLESLYGLMDYSIDNRDLVACVMAYSQNVDRATDWIGWLIDTMQAPKPEWLEEYEQNNQLEAVSTEEIPSY